MGRECGSGWEKRVMVVVVVVGGVWGFFGGGGGRGATQSTCGCQHLQD